MRLITRSNQPVAPATAMSSAQIMKAPTASAMLKAPEAPAVASTAAPGVDQATITGWRMSIEGTSEHSPMPSPSAQIQEVICPGVAWKAWAAWKTMATELVKPTSTATKPATKVDRLRSLKKDRTGTGAGRERKAGREGGGGAGRPGGGMGDGRRESGHRGLGIRRHPRPDEEYRCAAWKAARLDGELPGIDGACPAREEAE